MATQAPTAEAPEAAPAEAPPSKSRGLIDKIIVLAIVLAVVAGECVAAYLFIPSTEELTAAAGASIAAEAAAAPAEEEHEEEAAVVEVELGDFHITALQPLSNTNLRIDIKIFGMVAEEEHEKFAEEYEKNRHRLRDQVISTVRSADLADLTDAGLGLIRRRILETTNLTLGKPYLKAVVFSDFSVVEQ